MSGILNASGWTIVGTISQITRLLTALKSVHGITNLSGLNVVVLEQPVSSAAVAASIPPRVPKPS